MVTNSLRSTHCDLCWLLSSSCIEFERSLESFGRDREFQIRDVCLLRE